MRVEQLRVGIVIQKKKKKEKKKGKKGDIDIPNTGWLIKQACWEHSLVMR